MSLPLNITECLHFFCCCCNFLFALNKKNVDIRSSRRCLGCCLSMQSIYGVCVLSSVACVYSQRKSIQTQINFVVVMFSSALLQKWFFSLCFPFFFLLLIFYRKERACTFNSSAFFFFAQFLKRSFALLLPFYLEFHNEDLMKQENNRIHNILNIQQFVQFK